MNETFWQQQKKYKLQTLYFLLIIIFIYSLFMWLFLSIADTILWNIFSKKEHTIHYIMLYPWALLWGGIFLYLQIKFLVPKQIKKYLESLNIHLPDVRDIRHNIVANILEEVSLAAGIRKPKLRIAPVFLPNAFSITDFRDSYVIVTEGLINKLSRAELQSVIAHEVAHLTNSDTFIKSIISCINNMMKVIASTPLLLLEKSINENIKLFEKERNKKVILVDDKIINLNVDLDDYYDKNDARRQELAQQIFLFIVALIAKSIIGIVRAIILFLNLLISRKRELLADSTAAQYTRNPSALARALIKIGYNKNVYTNPFSANFEFSSLYICNPEYSSYDEEENFFSNIVSTHPPLKKRVKNLIAISDKNYEDYVKEVLNQKSDITINKQSNSQYYIVKEDNKLEGPLTYEDIYVKTIIPIFTKLYSPEIGTFLFEPIYNKEKKAGVCPKCSSDLYEILYEDVHILKCSRCNGVIFDQYQLDRILIRENLSFNETDIEFAKKIIAENKRIVNTMGRNPQNIDNSSQIKCFKCGTMMIKKFYNYTFFIVVDYCENCGLYFMDRGELEIIQMTKLLI